MKSGFSLVEVLVVILIVGVVGSACFISMMAGRSSWMSADTEISIQQELRKAVSQISSDVRQSGVLKVNITANSVPYDAISMYLCEGAGSSGALNWSASPVAYTLSSGQIVRTNGSDTRIVANNVTNLTFTRETTSSDIVRIAVSVQKGNSMNRVLNASLESSVKLRN